MKELSLSQGRVALVDDADFEWLFQWTWCANAGGYTFYAARNQPIDGRLKYIRMHRQILGLTDSAIHVDHKDRDGLNNQRHNLRICSRSQNTMNSIGQRTSTSAYKGVSWHKANNKWQAQIGGEQGNIYLGYFLTEEDAARAYDAAAREMFGDFARPNFVVT